MSKSIHIHSKIDDLLAMSLSDFERQFRGCCSDGEGRILSPQEVRTDLVRMKDNGVEVLMYGDCDNYDPKTGCNGHDEVSND